MSDEQKPQLTEDDVHRIVDKKVGEVLEAFRKEADSRSIGLASYEVGELARSAFSAFSDLTRAVADRSTDSEATRRAAKVKAVEELLTGYEREHGMFYSYGDELAETIIKRLEQFEA